MEIIQFENPRASTIFIQPIDRQEAAGMEREIEQIKNEGAGDFGLLAVIVDSWNQDLSPWPAPAVFGKEDFGQGAKDTLDFILDFCLDKSKKYYLGGYSLAGLFSLWAAFQTDSFSGIAAASPSAWFPSFTDYAKNHPCRCGNFYLSLGDREAKTKNPLMATVAACLEEIRAGLEEQGKETFFEWNPGNHFKDPDLRMARAFAYFLDIHPVSFSHK